MTYLLDTDTLIFLVRGLKLGSPRSEKERQKLRWARRILNHCQERQAAGDVVGLSAISVAELEFGAQNSGDHDTEIAAVRKILVPFPVFDFDAIRAAEHYGEVRHSLESAGTPIGAMDLLIAGHARALGAVLITHNTTHFSRVPGLTCEDWAI